MAKLNRDILREIFYETIKDKDEFSSRDTSLVNFMLAGKENLQMALDNFGQAKCANVEYYFETKMKRKVTLDFVDSRGNFNKYMFHLDFPLLKPFVVAAQIEELCVRPIISYAGEDAFMNYLMGESLTKITFMKTLPASNYGFMKRLCNLECFEIERSGLNVSMIPDSCRNLKVTNVNWEQSNKTSFKRIMPSCFQRCLLTKPENIKVTFVEELILDGGLRHSDFTPENIKSLISYISTHFPKLQSLDVTFQVFGRWSKIKETVLSLQPSTFKQISSNVKGSIVFHASNWSTTSSQLEYVRHKVSGKPYFIFQDNKIQKRFEIHDGLIFNFVCSFY